MRHPFLVLLGLVPLLLAPPTVAVPAGDDSPLYYPTKVGDTREYLLSEKTTYLTVVTKVEKVGNTRLVSEEAGSPGAARGPRGVYAVSSAGVVLVRDGEGQKYEPERPIL